MLELRPPLVIAGLVVGFFAIFHGHAHGTELPPGQSALLYSASCVAAQRTTRRRRDHRSARVACAADACEAEVWPLAAARRALFMLRIAVISRASRRAC